MILNKFNGSGGESEFYPDIAKQLWDMVNLMYSNLNNDSQLYGLRRKVRETK